MAADTREPQKAPNPSTSSISQGRTYETFNAPIAPENVNALPGGGLNTAGGKPKDAGLLEALKSVRLEELKEVHKKPCVRDALLTGIGAGFGMGGIRAIMGGKCVGHPAAHYLTEVAPIFRACNWAVGTFCFGSFAMYEFCQRKRQLEMQGLRRATEVIARKRTEKEIRAEEARVARRKAKE